MDDTPKPPCSVCGGMGTIYIDDLNSVDCECSRAKKIAAKLGPEIAVVKTYTKSPLFAFDDEGGILRDKTKDNLFLKCAWGELLPHLKLALYGKLLTTNMGYRFRVVTDERIRTVFVGAESYKARGVSRRDDAQTNNSLTDLIGPDFDLVIIRLGFLGHKNVAAPGALKEALMLREVGCKPTWIVEPPDVPFGPGHFTYSVDVGDYIENHFSVVNLTRYAVMTTPMTPSEPTVPETPSHDDGSEDVTVEAPEVTPAARFHAEPTPMDDMMAQLEGGGVKRKFGSKKKGGGPL